MGTSPKATVLRYFIKEWAVELKKSDEDMADCMGYAQRSGVWKLYKNQNRINPAKAAKAAQCLGISVRQLQFPPDVPSLDDMAEGASPEQRALMIADIARRMRR